MRRFLIPSLLFVALSSAVAHAHAFLDHANPLVGSTVANAPREVSLTFTQNLEAAFSSVQVTGPNGTQAIPIDANGQSVLSAAGTYLSPGAYTVSGSGGSGANAVGSFTAAAAEAIAARAGQDPE